MDVAATTGLVKLPAVHEITVGMVFANERAVRKITAVHKPGSVNPYNAKLGATHTHAFEMEEIRLYKTENLTWKEVSFVRRVITYADLTSNDPDSPTNFAQVEPVNFERMRCMALRLVHSTF